MIVSTKASVSRNEVPFLERKRTRKGTGFFRRYRPTVAHLFVRLLHDKGRLLRCFTQNIDSLESAAGVPGERVVAAHGNFDSATCVETGAAVDPGELKAAIDAGEPGWSALRDRHGGLVKPDIVFFGEGLPRRFFERASADLPECRLLLVIGTSLSVQPFASLVNHVRDDCVRVLINRDPVGRRDPRIPTAVLRQLGIGGGLEFDDPDRNYRDVGLLGSCDDEVWALAAELGWADDLRRLVEEADASAAARGPPPTPAAAAAPPPPPPPRRIPLPDAELPTPRGPGGDGLGAPPPSAAAPRPPAADPAPPPPIPPPIPPDMRRAPSASSELAGVGALHVHDAGR